MRGRFNDETEEPRRRHDGCLSLVAAQRGPGPPREVLSGSSGTATTCLLTPRSLYMMSDADTLRTPLSKYPFVFLAFES